ncbi:MAG: hypothetical protein ASARMPRED_006957 [Alectoria sarmentosa]|nr:MAG: hypothetical protein ASARMPRED_006957 [Alectoria sarmentosa]
MSPALPAMRPKDFLRQLPEAQPLTEHEECPVCLQKYVPTKTTVPGIMERLHSIVVRREAEAEHAVLLPCQHVLGSECIKRWISPADGNQNTCPYCVQQLFTPLEYPVSNHPSWDTLMDLVGSYGYAIHPNGRWRWSLAQGPAALSKKDLLDSQLLATINAGTRKRSHSESSLKYLDGLAVARLSTVHLREVVLYLQLQSDGVDLPVIEEINLEYPYLTLQKHHEDALFAEFEPRKLFAREPRVRSHRGLWEAHRKTGMAPEIYWETGKLCWAYP